jgi:DNA processing protein
VGSLAGHIEKAVDGTSPGNRAHELLGLPDEDLARAMARGHAEEFLERARSRDTKRLRAAVEGAGAWSCCRHDGLFPGALEDLDDAPGILFGRGDHGLLRAVVPEEAVTIVGSRRPSRYGRDLATDLAREVASAGLIVVSGMAMGIDSYAHQGALQAGGLTVAVLGTGVDVPYPARNARLYREIVERGLVVSELPPRTTARRWTFPARNRIMAALGKMTIVVEARERSGSLITAEMAQNLSREVGAVPGRVGSSSAAGANGLLRDGASVIRGADDVLDSMIGVGEKRRGGHQPRGPRLEGDLAEVLDLVERGSSTADALARASRLEPGPL